MSVIIIAVEVLVEVAVVYFNFFKYNLHHNSFFSTTLVGCRTHTRIIIGFSYFSLYLSNFLPFRAYLLIHYLHFFIPPYVTHCWAKLPSLISWTKYYFARRKNHEAPYDVNFFRTFLLPPSFFLSKNQPDALIIQIYSVLELYMFRASSLPIIRSFLLYIRRW